MLFDPHSHITEQDNSHNTQNYYPSQSFFNISAFTGQPDQSLASAFSQVRPEEWMPTVTPMETVQSDFGGRHEVPNMRVSFDIYGNELPVGMEADSPLMPVVTTKHMELESIQEEELASPGFVANQENSDPILGVITPLKRREPEQPRVVPRRMSFALTRNPLLDITPQTRRRKCSYNVETTTEKALFMKQNMTPTSERKMSGNDIPATRKIR